MNNHWNVKFFVGVALAFLMLVAFILLGGIFADLVLGISVAVTSVVVGILLAV